MVITGARFTAPTHSARSINSLVEEYHVTGDREGRAYKAIDAALAARGYAKDAGARSLRYHRLDGGMFETFMPRFDGRRTDAAAYLRVMEPNAHKVIDLLNARDATYGLDRRHYWAMPATGLVSAALNIEFAGVATALLTATGGFVTGVALAMAPVTAINFAQIGIRRHRRNKLTGEILSYAQSAFGRDAYLHALGQTVPQL